MILRVMIGICGSRKTFIRRPKFVAGLVEKAEISPSDLVVEIGPGKEIITETTSW